MIDPQTGSALISGAGSLFNGFLGLGGSNKAAKTQLQATRETNAMNYKIAQENNAFNEKMWNAQNEYNTPSAQKKRFEEAGLNPNLMMDGSSAGNASTSVTADTSGIQVAPDIGSTIAGGYEQFGNSISAAASQIAQQNYNSALMKANVNKINSETKHQDIENQYAEVSFMLDSIQKFYGGRISKTQLKYLEDTLDSRVSSAKAQAANDWSTNAAIEAGVDKSKIEQVLLSTQAHIEKVNLSWLPLEKQTNLRNVMANTTLALANADLSRAQKKAALAMAAYNTLLADGVKIDNRVKARVEDLSVGLIDNQYEEGLWKNEKSRMGLDIPSSNLSSGAAIGLGNAAGGDFRGYGYGHNPKYHAK